MNWYKIGIMMAAIVNIILEAQTVLLCLYCVFEKSPYSVATQQTAAIVRVKSIAVPAGEKKIASITVGICNSHEIITEYIVAINAFTIRISKYFFSLLNK